ncbi:hypothetical protein [Haliangium sp.]|uniref:hypothetical protein n=1 Tax=Haliangium sp. TaxID=2663208 RepID=UPI003D0A724D
MNLLGLTLTCWALLAPAPRPVPPPLAAASPGSAQMRAELTRLEGHRVRVAADGSGYVIEDIAGEGPPLVGVIERRGQALWLVTQDGAYRLTGPLAKPRITGPSYKIWVLGTATGGAGGPALRVRRLGVLAPPW